MLPFLCWLCFCRRCRGCRRGSVFIAEGCPRGIRLPTSNECSFLLVLGIRNRSLKPVIRLKESPLAEFISSQSSFLCPSDLSGGISAIAKHRDQRQIVLSPIHMNIRWRKVKTRSLDSALGFVPNRTTYTQHRPREVSIIIPRVSWNLLVFWFGLAFSGRLWLCNRKGIFVLSLLFYNTGSVPLHSVENSAEKSI